jgi:hypothetical protein
LKAVDIVTEETTIVSGEKRHEPKYTHTHIDIPSGRMM